MITEPTGNLTTPAIPSEPASRAVRITAETVVPFPCWMWQQMNSQLHSRWIHWDDDEWHKDNATVHPVHLGYTHYHPDQPTPPTYRPTEGGA